MRKQLKQAALVLATCGALAFGQTQPPADNTAANRRDGKSPTVTADKQSNKPSDRKLAQAIRKLVVADKDLSTYAHNVKIVVRDGVVTLRGPVKSEAEREKIAQLAANAGGTRIDNQIEIAPSPQS